MLNFSENITFFGGIEEIKVSFFQGIFHFFKESLLFSLKMFLFSRKSFFFSPKCCKIYLFSANFRPFLKELPIKSCEKRQKAVKKR